MEPLVCVVTPVYNGEVFLQRCLQSVAEQTYANWTHLIVDNASTDGSAHILAQASAAEPRIRVLRNKQTVDALENHNIAINSVPADAEYCKVLHADDELLPSCLEKMVSLAQQHPNVGIVGSYAEVNGKTVCKGLPEDRAWFEGSDAARRSLLGDAYPFWSPSCLLHRMSALTKREHFYRAPHLHADVECAYELLRDWDLGFVPETLTRIADHENSRTSRLAKPLKKLLAYNLDLFVRFGPEFIGPESYEGALKQHLKRYYEALATGIFDLQGAEFWQYHRKAFEDCGLPFSSAAVLQAFGERFFRSPIGSSRRITKALLHR
ncbi:MAG: glycosyltransferase family 2 protein [Pseudomonadota bacterium]